VLRAVPACVAQSYNSERRCLEMSTIALVTAGCAALLACDPHRERGLSGRASDEWSRSYSLEPDGELQIVAGNGSVDVTAASSGGISVRADRIAHASTDAAARGLLPHVRIREDVTANRVLLQDQGFGDVLVGGQAEVRFHVTAPAATRLRLRTLNGDIRVDGIQSSVVASTASGRIEAKSLGGGVDARSGSGPIVLDIAELTDRVSADAADGSVQLTLPLNAKADLEAHSTNGAVRISVPIETDGPSAGGHLRGRMNDGGVAIALTAGNGDVRIGPRP